MIKLEIYKDELYPVYGYTINNKIWGSTVDVTDEEFIYFEKAEKDFEKYQDRLEKLYNNK